MNVKINKRKKGYLILTIVCIMIGIFELSISAYTWATFWFIGAIVTLIEANIKKRKIPDSDKST